MSSSFLKKIFPKWLVLFVAIRYLKSSKNPRLLSTVSVFSLVGITLSVATLIVVMSVMTGFRLSLVEKIVGFGSHVSIFQKNERGIQGADELVRVAKSEKHVSNVHKIIQGQAMLVNRSSNKSTGIFLNGLERSNFDEKLRGFETSVGCNNMDFDDEDGIILTTEVAHKIGANINSSVMLISPEINKTIFGMIPRYKSYKVKCIVRIGMYQYDEVYSFVNFQSASKFFRTNGLPTMVDVVIDDVNLADEVSDSLVWHIDNKYMISDWKMENETMMKALRVEKSAMFMILSLFVGVAMFAIFSNLSLMVNEKTKSIAVFKSLGLSSFEIGQVFFLAGFIISLAGTMFGATLGILFAYNVQSIRHFLESAFGWDLFNPAIYFLSNLPSKAQPSDVFFVVSLSIFFALIASVFPAIKAARKEPAILLKYF